MSNPIDRAAEALGAVVVQDLEAFDGEEAARRAEARAVFESIDTDDLAQHLSSIGMGYGVPTAMKARVVREWAEAIKAHLLGES